MSTNETSAALKRHDIQLMLNLSGMEMAVLNAFMEELASTHKEHINHQCPIAVVLDKIIGEVRRNTELMTKLGIDCTKDGAIDSGRFADAAKEPTLEELLREVMGDRGKTTAKPAEPQLSPGAAALLAALLGLDVTGKKPTAEEEEDEALRKIVESRFGPNVKFIKIPLKDL